MSNPFENKYDQELRRRQSKESMEARAEQREKQIEQAEKKMAAKERAETVGKEVKQTKNQIVHIMANMTAVVKAVTAIRAQLQVANDGDIPSVQRDEKSLADLRKKLDRLFSEAKDLKVALLAEEEKSVREDNPDWKDEFVRAEAEKRTEKIWGELGL